MFALDAAASFSLKKFKLFFFINIDYYYYTMRASEPPGGGYANIHFVYIMKLLHARACT